MHALLPCLPTLVVSTIFCVWQAYQRTLVHRDRLLRERVAYLVWVVGTRAD